MCLCEVGIGFGKNLLEAGVPNFGLWSATAACGNKGELRLYTAPVDLN